MRKTQLSQQHFSHISNNSAPNRTLITVTIKVIALLFQKKKKSYRFITLRQPNTIYQTFFIPRVPLEIINKT